MGTLDRTVVIAEEQRAVDHAYDCVGLDQQTINRMRAGFRSDCPDAGLSSHPDLPSEFGRREDLGGLALVTMRVDLTDDPDDRLTWYLGRRTVRDGSGDLVVAKWTSPQATEWRLATPGRPRNVRLLRSLRCDERTVLDYSDDEIQPRTAAPAAPGAASSPGVPVMPAADPVAEEDAPEDVDPFLLADLDLARDGRMRDIVETIRRDQLRLVADERQGLLVVQGGPGTGKTAVGLHRVTWLLDNKRFASGEVLVVGPHREFLQYVGQVLPRLGSRDVSTVDIAQLWEGEVRGADSPRAHLVKSDERMAQVLRRAVEEHIRPDALADGPEEELAFTFRGATLRVPLAELEGMAREAQSAGGPYLVQRRRFVDRVLDRLMHEYSSATRRQALDEKFRAQLEKQPRVAKLLNSAWPTMSAERALRQLLDDEDALRTAASGLLTVEEQQAVLRPQARRIADEPWTLDDLVCLEELRHLLSGDESRRYRHIVVDEAQDLTPMQARSLARRCPTGSMTVLGDLAQTTGTRQYDVWGRLAGILAGSDGWHMAELTVGFRVPREVMDFAAPLAAEVSPSTAFPRPVRPAAEGALTVARFDPDEIAGEAASRALELSEARDGEARSVALIVPDDERLLTEVRRHVSAALDRAPAAEHERRISVLPAATAKGLEFDHVLVLEPAAIAQQGPAGLRQLYVAVTRCTQSLTIMHSAPLPAVLSGPEPEAAPAEETATMHDTTASPAAPTSAISPAANTTAVSTATAPERYDSKDHFLSSLHGRIRADRQGHAHQQLLYGLVAELFGARLQPSADSPLADITCEGPDGTVLYEIAAEGTGTYAEMRNAAVRLLEIEHAMGGKQADHLFLVLPQAPQDAWAPDALFAMFNISVIWKTPTGWDGANADIALARSSTTGPGSGE
ncbi:AAA family ATPase [Planomonospora sp. ID82291]|uniref:HelD family protein n=1 Tax=Planomonospora sp. ID82291 TaxID=2738136 RepID=UPI0018C43B44|nr:AAA family ATPase [Planomonospora sp. ID82291]MBG0816946.1 AAA family ATPase [Planomonospora sp. ID82291]